MVVMGVDSTRGFEYQNSVLDGLFALICCKSVMFVSKLVPSQN